MNYKTEWALKLQAKRDKRQAIIVLIIVLAGMMIIGRMDYLMFFAN